MMVGKLAFLGAVYWSGAGLSHAAEDVIQHQDRALRDGVCAPLPTRQWFFGSSHKTGTVLLAATAWRIQNSNPNVRIHKARSWHDALDDDKVTKSGHNVSSTRTLAPPSIDFSNHAHVDSASDLETLVAETRGAESKEARIVMIIRDPLEIILSGYFYHQRTEEPWVHKPLSRQASFCALDDRGNVSDECDLGFEPMFRRPCARATDAATGDLAGDAACVFRERVAANESLTYQDLMKTIDPPIGVAVEALRATREISRLNTTAVELRARPDVALILDLESVTADTASFRRSFTDAFDFLGAVDVGACVDIASLNDLNVHPEKTTMASHGMAGLPPGTAHVRGALREAIRTTAWFKTTLQPLRRDLGYVP